MKISSIFASTAAGALLFVSTAGVGKGDFLKVKSGVYVADGTADRPQIEDVYVELGDVVASLPRSTNQTSDYKEMKHMLRQSLGVTGNQPREVKIGVNFGSSKGFARFKPGPDVKLDVSRSGIVVLMRCYDAPTYYGLLVSEANLYLRDADREAGQQREESMKGFFRAMDEAALTLGIKDPAYVALYTSGLCDMVGSAPCSDDAKEIVEGWFQWACLDWKEKDTHMAEIQLSKLLDRMARSKDPAWCPWAHGRLLKRAYDSGLVPQYGHNSLCDRLIEEKKYEEALGLTFLELDDIIIGEDSYSQKVKNWFARGTSALRGIDNKLEGLQKLREKISSREVSAKPIELNYLQSLKRDLDNIQAGG